MNPTPTLYCDFTKNSQPIQAGIAIAYSGGANGTRFNENGLIVAAVAPRIDYDPTSIRLLNGAQFSERFVNWGLSGLTVTPNAISAPEGTGMADLLLEGAGNSEHYAEQPINVSRWGTWTQSFFVKPAGRSVFRMVVVHVGQAPTTSEIQVDLGVEPANFVRTNGLITSANVTVIGGGWYRISVVVTTDNTVSSLRARIGCEPSQGSPVYLGDVTKGFYVYGAQFEAGSSLSKYTPCPTTANVFSSPTPIGLLLEDARTNISLQSTFAAVWTPSRVTITNASGTAPDGNNTATQLKEDATLANTHFVAQTVTTVLGSVYAWSVWAKAGSGSLSKRWLALNSDLINVGFEQAIFDLLTGTVSQQAFGNSAAIQAYPNGWYRCSVIGTARVSGIINLQPMLANAASGAGAITYDGDNTSNILLWGAQFELGTEPSSYIATAGATVTRTVDQPVISSLGAWFNSAEGTLIAKFISKGGNPANPLIFGFSDGTNNNIIGIRQFSGNVRFNILVGAAAQVNSDMGAINDGIQHRVAVAYKGSAASDVLDGGFVLTPAGGTLPTVSQVNLGCNPSLSGGNLVLDRIEYYPWKLSDQALKTLSIPTR